MNPRFRQSLCLSVAVLSTVAAAGILQTPARAMALNSFGGFGRGRPVSGMAPAVLEQAPP